MANWYLKSTTGSDANNGTTWALAKATIQGIQGSESPGDTIYVSQAHSEDTAASNFFNFGGLTNASVRIICAQDNAEPPVSSTTGASVYIHTANSEMQINGSFYAYGMRMVNTGTATCSIWLHNGATSCQFWENCTFELNSSTANVLFLNAVDTSSGDITFRNTNLKFGAATSFIKTQNDKFTWEGGGFLAGTTSPDGLFEMVTFKYADIQLTGVDFSQLSTNFYLVSGLGSGKMVLRDCKMPAGWAGDFYSGALSFAFRGELYNCYSGATNLKLRIREHMGVIDDESTIIKQGGASDGVNAYSLRFSANGECNPEYNRLRSPEINVWNDATSSSLTLAFDILTDSVTPLTTRDVAIEVVYLGDSASPLGTVASSRPSNILTAGASLASSSATWITTGITNVMRQRPTVTFTPMQRGYIQTRVVLTQASTLVYVDPQPQIT
jgi:hypothetical protein